MLDDHFLVGFADELTLQKEAAHPLFSSITRGGTMLGRKVRGMMTRVSKRSRKPRVKNLRKKAEDLQRQVPMKQPNVGKELSKRMVGKPPAKPAIGTPPPRKAIGTEPARTMGKMGAAAEKAGRTVKNVLEQATPDAEAHRGTDDGSQVLTQGADDPRYGGGMGNFKGKKAPAFTDKVNPTDLPRAFGKN